MNKIKWESKKEDIKQCALNHFFPKEFDCKSPDFEIILAAYGYSAACKDLFLQYPITPHIVSEIALHYMLYRNKPRTSIMIINRKNKVKEIIDIARDYKAKAINFTKEIEYYCKTRKSKKCIIMYNYHHKVSTYVELTELDRLYSYLGERGITLVDVIRVTDGRATRLISHLNDSGYANKKNAR